MDVKLNRQTCRADMKEVMTWGKSRIEELAFRNILIKYLACGGEHYNVRGGGHPEWSMAQEHEWPQEDKDEWNLFPTKGSKLESPQILALFFFQQRLYWVHNGIDIASFNIHIFLFWVLNPDNEQIILQL